MVIYDKPLFDFQVERFLFVKKHPSPCRVFFPAQTWVFLPLMHSRLGSPQDASHHWDCQFHFPPVGVRSKAWKAADWNKENHLFLSTLIFGLQRLNVFACFFQNFLQLMIFTHEPNWLMFFKLKPKGSSSCWYPTVRLVVLCIRVSSVAGEWCQRACRWTVTYSACGRQGKGRMIEGMCFIMRI